MRSRPWSLVVLTTIAALVATGSLLSSCSTGHSEADRERLKKAEEEFEQRISDDTLDAGPIVVGDAERSTEFGRIEGSGGLTLPEEFPEDVPLLDKGHLTMVHHLGEQWIVGYTVPLPWRAAAKALQTDLRAKSWWIEDGRGGDGVAVFTARRPEGRSVNLSIGDREGGKSALVMVRFSTGQ